MNFRNVIDLAATILPVVGVYLIFDGIAVSIYHSFQPLESRILNIDPCGKGIICLADDISA